MTDKEMAEQFADNINGFESTCSLLSAKDKNHAYRLGRYEGFLTGLKVGRPKWHKVADGDLPKTKKKVLVLLKDVEEPILDYYRQNGLWNYALENEVIAWKEIVLPELKE